MNRPARVTIKDVAAAAGVTATTVSDSLSGKGRLPEETRARVREVATRLGYRPNAIARGLRGNGLGLIGLVIAPAAASTLSTVWYWAAIANHATEVALLAGYALVLLPHSVARLEAMPIPLDGAILVDPGVEDPVLGFLLDSGAPVVTVGRDTSRDHGPWVDDDNIEGARKLLQRTARPGSRVTMVTVGPLKSYAIDTLAGARRWASETGSALSVQACSELDPQSVKKALDAALASPVDVLLAQTDRLALLILPQLQARGLKVPGDILVMSATDGPDLLQTRPSITAAHQHPEQLGRLAAKTLIDIMHGTLPPARQLLNTEVVIRRSAPALRAGSPSR
jgi:DNA-binding LacI/PurR family transcriptional regulator